MYLRNLFTWQREKICQLCCITYSRWNGIFWQTSSSHFLCSAHWWYYTCRLLKTKSRVIRNWPDMDTIYEVILGFCTKEYLPPPKTRRKRQYVPLLLVIQRPIIAQWPSPIWCIMYMPSRKLTGCPFPTIIQQNETQSVPEKWAKWFFFGGGEGRPDFFHYFQTLLLFHPTTPPACPKWGTLLPFYMWNRQEKCIEFFVMCLTYFLRFSIGSNSGVWAYVPVRV